ncbi:hypothetical protein G6F23_014073 [Rhizopus arrhizus]|nr:hypothetical protein G6F23_014073 [Rhizopus arrhizus]
MEGAAPHRRTGLVARARRAAELGGVPRPHARVRRARLCVRPGRQRTLDPLRGRARARRVQRHRGGHQRVQHGAVHVAGTHARHGRGGAGGRSGDLCGDGVEGGARLKGRLPPSAVIPAAASARPAGRGASLRGGTRRIVPGCPGVRSAGPASGARTSPARCRRWSDGGRR